MAYNIPSSIAESVLKDSYMMNFSPPPGLTQQHQNYYQQSAFQTMKPSIQVSELENQYINVNKPKIHVPVPGSTANLYTQQPSVSKNPDIENILKEQNQFKKELIDVLVNFKSRLDSFDQFKSNIENQIGTINDRLDKLTDLVMILHTDFIKLDVNKEEITTDQITETVKVSKTSTQPSDELIEEVYILLSDETKPMLLNTIRSKLPKKVLPPSGLRGVFKQLIDNVPGIKKVIEKRVDSIGEVRDEYLYYIYDNEKNIEGFNKICKSGKQCKLNKKGECSICK
jgi:hypothetical protein